MRARLDLSQEGRVSRMAKAILVMDMPKTCIECRLSRAVREKHTGQLCFECVASPMIMITSKECKSGRKIWCPLLELEKKETKTLNEFLEEKQDVKIVENFIAEEFMKYGYNACIDEILGGGENG